MKGNIVWSVTIYGLHAAHTPSVLPDTDGFPVVLDHIYPIHNLNHCSAWSEITQVSISFLFAEEHE